MASGGDSDLMGPEGWLLNVGEFCKSVPKPAGSLKLDLAGVTDTTDISKFLTRTFFSPGKPTGHHTPARVGALGHSLSLGQAKPHSQ